MKYVEMTLEQARKVINGISGAGLGCTDCPLYEKHKWCPYRNCHEVVASAGMIIGRESARLEFEMCEPVMVRDYDYNPWVLRYFAGKSGKEYLCWGKRYTWKQCRKPTAEERERYVVEE